MSLCPLIFALILMLIGLAGIIIPGLPDLVFIFLGALVYAIWTGFSTISVGFILFFLGLTIFGLLLDWLGAALGIKKTGATRWGIFGAVLGGILGVFFAGIFGMILLAAVGTVIFEMIFAKKNLTNSVKAGIGSIIGIICGIFLKLILAGVMISLFLVRIF